MKKFDADATSILIATQILQNDVSAIFSYKDGVTPAENADHLANFIKQLSARLQADIVDDVIYAQIHSALKRA
ncbi:hypothetical protein [Aquitalea magnusonii]|uniref:Uncharacterized protein n=1 Tax=Aquitalea magnusonii TaxID=332411 RepID=A0A318JL58_9NEIS|nr:hypothetical protein [Aquitalea magnusonii]PXX49015.1 hypothetical protein DFR38_10551 [Aquitalea magnusonii]